MAIRLLSSSRLPPAALICAVLFFAGVAAFADEPGSGEQIYSARCAKCHGEHGEGTREHHPDPLVGDRSVAELARLIQKSMPEDEPGTCSAEDAEHVAAYIYGAFYSPAARMRNQPARIELARLTVRQYQNVVSDLIASFCGDAQWSDQHGLHAEYFRSRNFDEKDRVLDRIDPQVNFDFGDGAPAGDKFDAGQFSIRWQGMLLAPDTGDYDFVVRTQHAARLWINHSQKPLIDAWVKSGNDTEFRGTIHLLAGRVYPVRLEFSKAKQGVDDSAKNKNPPPASPASIALLWKLPHLAAEAIPERALWPTSTPEVFVVQTPFPPDDRSTGYERGTSISKQWDQATTDAAIETADYVAAHLDALAGTAESAPDRPQKVREFCDRFVEQAFRRPLSDAQKAKYVEHQFQAADDHLELAVKRVTLLTLKSPWFLYREIAPLKENAQFDVAARLSFGLWDSLPDAELWRAAKSGELWTHELILHQAQRMLADLRARTKLREFFLQWLKVDQVADLSKDPAQYPDFSEQVAGDLRTSLELFVEGVLWNERSDFRQLFLTTAVPVDERLANFLGVKLPEADSATIAPKSAYSFASLSSMAPFQNVELEPEHRAGILTHPYLLATFAHAQTSSPIHRGVFISRNLLGRALKPPPEAMVPLAAELHPDLTTRQRVALQTGSQACMVCHATINPLGFTLENFDAVGRFRSEELGKPIDASGGYETRSGEEKQFAGVRELAKFLADSDETHTAFTEHLFQYLIKQPIRAYGPNMLNDLKTSFERSEFNMLQLAAKIAAEAAEVPEPAESITVLDASSRSVEKKD
jgi:Protein of unknown function (DUF1592)/Protein of unknown function (DUF1588)/PA14 domain/Protein of unknown function (DUF1595)/Cytochrome C oxidase, cbb3-type, subunit III